MPAHSALQEILTLDPERDHLRIVYLVSFQEFPWDTTRSLEVALMRTFAGPLTSAILAQTGELTQRPPKRYDDTDLILSEILEHGYDSERGWRPMVEQEQLMIFHYWREIGRRMNIKDIPSDFAAFERYNVQFEREHFAYSKDTAAAATRTRDMFLGWFLPKFLYPVGAPFLHALLDDSLLEAFGFPKPPAGLRRLVSGLLRTRGRLLRLLPERRQPRLRTVPRRPTYPKGYQVDELGPNLDAAPVPAARDAA